MLYPLSYEGSRVSGLIRGYLAACFVRRRVHSADAPDAVPQRLAGQRRPHRGLPQPSQRLAYRHCACSVQAREQCSR